MAGVPPIEYRFKKGEVHNPTGKSRMPEELKRANKLTRIQFDTLLNRFLQMKTPELNDIMSSDESPQIEKLVGSIIREAVNKGCPIRLNFLLEKIMGKLAWEEDRTLNVTPENEAKKDTGPVYKVLVNRDGKFVHARPQLKQAEPQAETAQAEVLPPEET